MSRAERRVHDNSRFCDAIARLTGFRPASACREALPRDILAQPVPPPSAILARFEDRLSQRTVNALRRHVAAGPDRELWTRGRLLEIRGFGVFALMEVLELLQSSS